MLPCFTSMEPERLIRIKPVLKTDYPAWLKKQGDTTRHWLESINFSFDAIRFALIPHQGNIDCIVVLLEHENDYAIFGALATGLPKGSYDIDLDGKRYLQAAYWWGLGAYQFTKYKAGKKYEAKLYLPDNLEKKKILNYIESVYFIRDLINTPNEDLGPLELALAAKDLANQYQAMFKEVVGIQLKKENFPAIYAVGKSSTRDPRLIQLTWGEDHHPHLVLVGKGVCFDTGGYNIKVGNGMSLMKKDMGGAAHVLGLARMIMDAKLPIKLTVVIPAVENLISATAYKPSDIIKTRKGLTIEIGNTDAEGRVILSDALWFAAELNPKLIIDFATLTGAARVALGPSIGALFSNRDNIAQELQKISFELDDPVWQLPLYRPYRSYIDCPFADINNNSLQPYAGAITAGLFLQEFVGDCPWVHLDIMAWNISLKPGRPEGGEATAIQTVFHYLEKCFIKHVQ